jgi:hypothetical protein
VLDLVNGRCAQAQIDRPARSCRQIFTTFWYHRYSKTIHLHLNNNNVHLYQILDHNTGYRTMHRTQHFKSENTAAFCAINGPSSVTAWHPRRDPSPIHDSKEPPTIAVSHPNVFRPVVHRHPPRLPSSDRCTLPEASVAGHSGVSRPTTSMNLL